MCKNFGMRETEIVGQRLRRLRKAAGLNQHDLAAKAGVSFRSIQEIEGGRGNPTLDTLVILSGALKSPLMLVDVERYVSKDAHDTSMSLLAKDHQKKCAALAEVTKKSLSLQEKYIKTLEQAKELNQENSVLRAELKQYKAMVDQLEGLNKKLEARDSRAHSNGRSR